MAVPGEDEDVTIYSSTQHPSEVQHMVGACARRAHRNAVTVDIRRMGGGFGGKETQGNQFAAHAAIAAKKLGRAVKIRPDRDDDMVATGKRHDFLVDYEVGFDDEGRILGVDVDVRGALRLLRRTCRARSPTARCSTATTPISIRRCELSPRRSTPTPCSNTAFRGFGGPQGMVGAERVIEEIAFAVGKDPLEIRKRNFYGTSDRNVTPYHQTVEDNIIHRDRRRAGGERRLSRRAARAIAAFNANEPRHQARHRADAGEVRHLVHGHAATTRPARWCMSIPTARSI